MSIKKELKTETLYLLVKIFTSKTVLLEKLLLKGYFLCFNGQYAKDITTWLYSNVLGYMPRGVFDGNQTIRSTSLNAVSFETHLDKA